MNEQGFGKKIRYVWEIHVEGRLGFVVYLGRSLS